ncbi:MAG: 23S rRNA (uracil(1939)-C(5))-methyltransferase RlmD [Chitinophagales bacterium]
MARSKKKISYDRLVIEKISSEGAGITYVDDKVVFVDKTVPGDECSATVYQKRKNFNKAKVDELFVASEMRQDPFCQYYGTCGGCKLQHLKYEEQANYKQKSVYDAFERVAKVEVKEIFPILKCDKTQYYRNKMEYTFSNRRWLTQEEINYEGKINRQGLGLHVPGGFSKVVNLETCYLPDSVSNRIRNFTKAFCQENNMKFYDLLQQVGLMRNLVIRTTSTGEVMVLVIFFQNEEEKINLLMTELQEAFPEITSLNYIINGKKNDSYPELEVVNFAGKPFMIEVLGDYKFKIRPKSFFQTNSLQAKNLYDVVKSFADLNKEDIVYDLYSGVGSIGIYLSGECKKIVGIEIIDQAVEDAKENAALNKVENASFNLGDVTDLLNQEFIAQNGKPTVLVTDPPRAGMHPDVVKTILEAEVPKIVYVSCNPGTQARDINLLSEKYEVLKIQPVDMFPQTTHIENVAVLKLK